MMEEKQKKMTLEEYEHQKLQNLLKKMEEVYDSLPPFLLHKAQLLLLKHNEIYVRFDDGKPVDVFSPEEIQAIDNSVFDSDVPGTGGSIAGTLRYQSAVYHLMENVRFAKEEKDDR